MGAFFLCSAKPVAIRFAQTGEGMHHGKSRETSAIRPTIQPQVRRYLTATAALMVLWITVRSIRYMIAQDPWVLRHLWYLYYLYYLPMLFIPLLAVLVALSLGKGDHFR